jgi:hypothetical protein
VSIHEAMEADKVFTTGTLEYRPVLGFVAVVAQAKGTGSTVFARRHSGCEEDQSVLCGRLAASLPAQHMRTVVACTLCTQSQHPLGHIHHTSKIPVLILASLMWACALSPV